MENIRKSLRRKRKNDAERRKTNHGRKERARERE